jgi:hypothetical protein
MVAVYLTFGLLFLCTTIAIDIFPTYRTGVGLTMLIYAVIRLVLTIKKNKDQYKNEL